MAVVILVKGQHHKAPAGQLNGIGVLHFCGVQIAVGHNDRGLGVVGGGVLRHIQKSAELTVAPVKADAGDLRCPCAAVEHSCQDTAQQDQHQSCTQQSPCAFADFHRIFPPLFLLPRYAAFCFVSCGNFIFMIHQRSAKSNKNLNFHALVPCTGFCYTIL